MKIFDSVPDGDSEVEQEQPSSGLAGWFPIISAVIFCLLYFVFRDRPWGLHFAVAAAYTFFTFFIAIGGSCNDLDDLFGNLRIARCVTKLMVPHALVLACIMLTVSLWLFLRSHLPIWMTQEGHKGSFWDWCGWLPLIGAGLWQGVWMAAKIKQRLGDPATEDQP